MLLYILIPLLGIALRLGRGTKISIINSGLLLLYWVIGSYDVNLKLGNWLDISNFTIDWEIKIDMITRGILFPILFINLLVQIFSLSYMSGDPHVNRYNLYLNFFVATMILLVTADNLFVLFVGWEGVGLASYLLINFWFVRIYANLAGIKAFLTNRIGDWGLTLGLLFYWLVHGSFSLDISFESELTSILVLGVLLGAITKSAQIGLHSWLTRSMEGPTPVSALLHAATMVTAGVYLLLRLELILEWSSSSLLIICWLGGLSALGGAIGGLLEYDIKKIIAYSTISQLGYMFISIGCKEYNLALWHLINHACFKALLFLSAGALIHSLFGIQDIRKFGRLGLPVVATAFLIGNLSIMAIPFMTGWWSKDKILILIYECNSFLYILIFLAAIITAAYSIKLYISCFKSLPRLSYNNWKLIGDSDYLLMLPLLILMVFAIGLGYISSLVDFYLPQLNGVASLNLDVTGFNLTIALILIGALGLISGISLKVGYALSLLDQIDLIYLRCIVIVASGSTYLYRNYQGFLEILGGTGISRFIEVIAFKLEILGGYNPKQQREEEM